MKLSIIIPIYNVERYVVKCLDSILVDNVFTGQVICVNDGSTDGSGKILEEYNKKYPNVEVITQPNAGLSAARNAGIKAAKGEYVCFLDSDDYIEQNVLNALLKQVETEQLDVLRYDYQNVRIVKSEDVRDMSEYEIVQPYKQPHKVDTRKDVVDGVTYLNERMGYECYAVMFIIRRELVPQFTIGIHFEDVDWLPRMMLKVKRVNSTTTIVYNYLTRQGSITQTQGDKNKIRRNLEDRMGVIETYGELRKQNPKCTWLRNMQSSMVAGVLTTVARVFYDERKVYISRLRAMNVFPLAITNHGKTYVRRARLINLFGSKLYCLIMHCLS